MDGRETSTIDVEVQGNGEAWRVVVSGFDSKQSAKEWAADHGMEDVSPADQNKMHRILLDTCSSVGRFRAMLRSDQPISQEERNDVAQLLEHFEEYLMLSWPMPK